MHVIQLRLLSANLNRLLTLFEGTGLSQTALINEAVTVAVDGVCDIFAWLQNRTRGQEQGGLKYQPNPGAPAIIVSGSLIETPGSSSHLISDKLSVCVVSSGQTFPAKAFTRSPEGVIENSIGDVEGIVDALAQYGDHDVGITACRNLFTAPNDASALPNTLRILNHIVQTSYL
jgi:hypothetical protein